MPVAMVVCFVDGEVPALRSDGRSKFLALILPSVAFAPAYEAPRDSPQHVSIVTPDQGHNVSMETNRSHS